MSASLTKRQSEALAAIVRLQRHHGYAPTVRELCTHLGVRSTHTVTGYLEALEDKGFIKRTPNASRGLVVLKPGEDAALVIPADWQPTTENLNALPEPLRRYVFNLQTLCDPAGMVQENTILRDVNAGLQTYVDQFQRNQPPSAAKGSR